MSYRGIYGRVLFLAAIIGMSGATSQAAEKEISVWSYYTAAPFITEEGRGLSHDLVQLMNEYAEGRYRFKLEVIPRPRINRKLEAGEPGIVLLVNWVWMGDKQKTKYLWSPPILRDRNEILSRQAGKSPVRIHYEGADSLKGMVFGGEAGRRYKGLQEAIAAGMITRRDARREELNLDMLLKGRIDVTSAASTYLRYMIKSKGFEGKFFFSPKPLFSYTRHFLITREVAEVEGMLAEFVNNLPANEKWQAIKEDYGVE